MKQQQYLRHIKRQILLKLDNEFSNNTICRSEAT
jgi:hypothetical protein